MVRWLGALFAGLVAVALAPSARALELKCNTLNDIALAHATVTKVTTDPLRESGKACHVVVASKPAPGVQYRIEAWIPVAAAWNGKFVQIGAGGFNGAARSEVMEGLTNRGYAVASVEAIKGDADAGALKDATDIAKTLISATKGGPPTRSYFGGCGEGGRQALTVAQRFPGDFDVVVAGAPTDPLEARPDLSAFRARGGKLIVYQRAADPDAPAHAAIAYYQSLAQTVGDPSGFLRLYLVPGLLGCGEADGPRAIDWLLVADRWSVAGAAPGAVGQGVCPYPLTLRGGRCAGATPVATPPPPRRRHRH